MSSSSSAASLRKIACTSDVACTSQIEQMTLGKAFRSASTRMTIDGPTPPSPPHSPAPPKRQRNKTQHMGVRYTEKARETNRGGHFGAFHLSPANRASHRASKCSSPDRHPHGGGGALAVPFLPVADGAGNQYRSRAKIEVLWLLFFRFSFFFVCLGHGTALSAYSECVLVV